MTLIAIAAAIEATTATDASLQQTRDGRGGGGEEHVGASSPVQHSSSISESTSAETDPFESDSSTPKRPVLSSDVAVAPSTEGQSAKKRRASTTPCTTTNNTNKARKASPKDEEAVLSTGGGIPASQADVYPAEMLLDLAGSTSAEVRRMNDDERALVHYKRRLRNRESAKRSRARRQATISDVQHELEDLKQLTSTLLDRCIAFARTNERQSQELETMRKEKHLLESLLRSSDSSI